MASLSARSPTAFPSPPRGHATSTHFLTLARAGSRPPRADRRRSFRWRSALWNVPFRARRGPGCAWGSRSNESASDGRPLAKCGSKKKNGVRSVVMRVGKGQDAFGMGADSGGGDDFVASDGQSPLVSNPLFRTIRDMISFIFEKVSACLSIKNLLQNLLPQIKNGISKSPFVHALLASAYACNIDFRNVFRWLILFPFLNACVVFSFMVVRTRLSSHFTFNSKTLHAFRNPDGVGSTMGKNHRARQRTSLKLNVSTSDVSQTYSTTQFFPLYSQLLESQIPSLLPKQKSGNAQESRLPSDVSRDGLVPDVEEWNTDRLLLDFEHSDPHHASILDPGTLSSDNDFLGIKSQVLKRIETPSSLNDAYKKIKQKVKTKIIEELEDIMDLELSSNTSATVDVKPNESRTKYAAPADKRLAKFVEEVKLEALKSGVSEATLNRALTGIQALPEVQERSIVQSEFTLSAENYIESIVTDSRVQDGIAMHRKHREVLKEIEKEYGVPGHIVVAIWGIESSYGINPGKFKIVQVLLTHAFTSTQRNAFFRKELIQALRILDRRSVEDGKAADPNSMVGSWAGAMGQCQFMPSSFQAYAVAYKRNKTPDIWKNTSDVLASIANYLSKNGWQQDQPYGLLVKIPPKFNSSLSGFNTEKSIWDWKGNFGITAAPNQLSILGSVKCSLVIPSKSSNGVGYLATKNFQAVMRYNQSSLYAMAVGELSHKILLGLKDS